MTEIWLCPCGAEDMLADTEGWVRPLCVDCHYELGEPRREPAAEVVDVAIAISRRRREAGEPMGIIAVHRCGDKPS